jgi:hypothetical protein
MCTWTSTGATKPSGHASALQACPIVALCSLPIRAPAVTAPTLRRAFVPPRSGLRLCALGGWEGLGFRLFAAPKSTSLSHGAAP